MSLRHVWIADNHNTLCRLSNLGGVTGPRVHVAFMNRAKRHSNEGGSPFTTGWGDRLDEECRLGRLGGATCSIVHVALSREAGRQAKRSKATCSPMKVAWQPRAKGRPSSA